MTRLSTRSRDKRVERARRRRLQMNRRPLLETLERRELLTATVDNMHLADDTGVADWDKMTDNPTLEAVASGDFDLSGGSVEVQFDHDSDGVSDGSASVTTAGSTFQYDPRTSDPALNSYTGLLNMNYRAVEKDASGTTIATGSWSLFSYTLASVVNSEIDVVDDLYASVADDVGSVSYGSTNVAMPVSKMFTIHNWGSDDLSLNPNSVQLPNGFSVVSPFDSTVMATGGSTMFEVQLDANDPGSYGGTISFDTNDSDESPFNFTVLGEVIAMDAEIEVRTQYGQLVDDGTETVDIGSTDPGVAKQLTFHIRNWGAMDLTLDDTSLVLPSGFSLVSGFSTNVSSYGGNTSMTLQLDGTTSGSYSGTVSFDNSDADEATFDFTLTGTVLNAAGQITVDGLGLDNDTGSSDTDRITTDPTISAIVNGEFDGGSVDVEFDHNANGSADGTVNVATSGAALSYDPRTTDANLIGHVGAVALKYRYIKKDSGGAVVDTGSWTDFDFTMEGDPSVAGISIDEFGLWRDTGSSNTDRVTVHPTLVGKATGDFAGGSVKIEFDHDNDQSAEGSVDIATTDSEFEYDPRAVDSSLVDFVGAVTVRYRVLKYDSGGALEATGSWVAYSLTMEAPPASSWTIEELGLVNDTGDFDGDHVTYDPRVSGSAMGFDGGRYAPIEFDLDGNGSVDDTVRADEENRFEFEPDVPYGSVTVNARALEWDLDYATYLRGPWAAYTFNYTAKPAADIVNFGLVNDTGSDVDDDITVDPTVTGKLADGAEDRAYVRIELDLDNNGTTDVSTSTDQFGTFIYRPTGLADGAHTIRARSIRHDLKSEADIAGSWFSYTFTFEAQPVADVSDVRLFEDSGVDTSDGVTANPIILGTLTSVGELAQLRVEVDHDGNGTVDGRAITDSQGRFRYFPVGLATGARTLNFRSTEWDENAEANVSGDWAAFTFTYQPDTLTAVSVEAIRLARDTGDDDSDGVTSDATIAGNFPASEQPDFLVVEFDHDGDSTLR